MWGSLLARFRSSARLDYAFVLSLVFATLPALAFQSDRAIDRELTGSALSKCAALAGLATVTLSEKLDRLVDIGISLADRVRFRELMANPGAVHFFHFGSPELTK